MTGAQTKLTLNGYDPESVAAASQSSRAGRRKMPETWNVSSSPASTPSHVQRVQCVPVCIAQALLGAFEDLKAAVEEYQKGIFPVRVAPAQPKAGAPIAPKPLPAALPAVPAVTKAELTAKEKAIQSKDAALQSREEELKLMKVKLETKESELSQAKDEKEKSMAQLLEGARAQGACIHLRLHRCPTVHHTIVCFHASRHRSCQRTGGRDRQLAPAGLDNDQRRPHEQRPLGRYWCGGR